MSRENVEIVQQVVAAAQRGRLASRHGGVRRRGRTRRPLHRGDHSDRRRGPGGLTIKVKNSVIVPVKTNGMLLTTIVKYRSKGRANATALRRWPVHVPRK